MVNTWKIVAAALAIFAAGVLTGGITVGITGRFLRQGQAELRHLRMTNSIPSPSSTATNLPYRGPGSPRLNQVRNAVQIVDVTALQKDRILALTRESEEMLREQWESVGPRIQRELRILENRVAETLEPKQRVLFRELLKKKPWEIRAALTNGATTLLATNGTTTLPATNGAAGTAGASESAPVNDLRK